MNRYADLCDLLFKGTESETGTDMKRRARILDEFLAASARAGNRKAFAQLAERWQPKLLAHANRLLGDREAARDVVQEAWADIAKGLSRLDDVRAFPAWAYRIVTRRSADMIRKRQRSRRLNAAYAAENAVQPQSEAAVESGADAAPLQAAIARLSADQRAAVALFYIEDFSIAEIAAALNTPAGTIKSRLMHARRNLRAALEGGESHG